LGVVIRHIGGTLFRMPAQRFLVLVLTVLGILAVIAAVIYFAEPAKSLPSILPGHIAGSTVHRTHRGIAALVVGVALLVAAAAAASMARPHRRRTV
jgi:hypothetical protein